MESRIIFNQNDLILRVNKNYDRSILNLDKWESYLDVLCGDREYQKDAIKSSLIYLASENYDSIEQIVLENYNNNTEIRKKYLNINDYYSELQMPGKLFANIDLATGTGKSYVIFGVAQIMLAEGIVKRVLVLCPSLKAAQILSLSEDEKNEMYNLAGDKRNEIPPDLPDYIMNRGYVSAALRTARDLDAGEEDWQRFVEALKKRKE